MGKKRIKRNISGLKNQSKKDRGITPPLPIPNPAETVDGLEKVDDDDQDSDDDEHWKPAVWHDSNKLCWIASDEEDESAVIDHMDNLSDNESQRQDDEHPDGEAVGIFGADDQMEAADVDWENEGMQVGLMRQAINEGDDPRDESWIPTRLRRKIYTKKGRPKKYKKGPDLGSKSKRTQRRYRNLLQNQTSLDTHGFTLTKLAPSSQSDMPTAVNGEGCVNPIKYEEEDSESSLCLSVVFKPQALISAGDVTIRMESPAPVVLHFDSPIREESMTPPRLLFLDDEECLLGRKRRATSQDVDVSESDTSQSDSDLELVRNPADNTIVNTSTLTPNSESATSIAESWEDELDEALYPNNTEIRDWTTLRNQIKADLQTKSQMLLPGQVNQLLIIRTDIIRRFINRSWRFMDAYRIGLSGPAALWAVRKQRGHRAVSRSAMMHLDAVVDQACRRT